MTEESDNHDNTSQFTQDSQGNLIIGLGQTTIIPRVPSEKVRHRQADKIHQLAGKYTGVQDLNKMIQNPDELERLLNELVDYFHQLHFLAVIVNLFNVIDAITGVFVKINKNSSGTTSLELRSTQKGLGAGVTPSELPAETQKMFMKGVDSTAKNQFYNDGREKLQVNYDLLINININQ